MTIDCSPIAEILCGVLDVAEPALERRYRTKTLKEFEDRNPETDHRDRSSDPGHHNPVSSNDSTQ